MNLQDAIKILENYAHAQEKLEIEELNFNKIHYLTIDNIDCVMRELTWKEGLSIDFNSHLNINSEYLQNTKKEKYDILNLAILKIDGKKTSIDSFDIDFVNKLWEEYKKYLHLSSDEIKFLYNSAKKYFSPDEKEYFPLHPLILEVDYMTKGIVTFSKIEFELLSIREFEAIQLILSAKNEV